MQKKLLSVICDNFSRIVFVALMQVPGRIWHSLPQCIKQTSFPDKNFNVVKYGASEKNPSIKNTKAINAAINRL